MLFCFFNDKFLNLHKLSFWCTHVMVWAMIIRTAFALFKLLKTFLFCLLQELWRILIELRKELLKIGINLFPFFFTFLKFAFRLVFIFSYRCMIPFVRMSNWSRLMILLTTSFPNRLNSIFEYLQILFNLLLQLILKFFIFILYFISLLQILPRSLFGN